MVSPELPENSPRYVLLSYELEHKDGRKSFPLVFINWAPTSSETGLLTLHASGFLDFQTTVRESSSLVSHVLIIETTLCFKADVSKVGFDFLTPRERLLPLYQIIEIRDGAESLSKAAIDAKLLS